MQVKVVRGRWVEEVRTFCGQRRVANFVQTYFKLSPLVIANTNEHWS